MKSFVLQSSVSVSDKFGKCCSLYIDDNEFCRLTVLYTEAGKIFQPLRVALTGLPASPGIFDVLVMLGRERSLARLESAIAYLRNGSSPTI